MNVKKLVLTLSLPFFLLFTACGKGEAPDANLTEAEKRIYAQVDISDEVIGSGDLALSVEEQEAIGRAIAHWASDDEEKLKTFIDADEVLWGTRAGQQMVYGEGSWYWLAANQLDDEFEEKYPGLINELAKENITFEEYLFYLELTFLSKGRAAGACPPGTNTYVRPGPDPCASSDSHEKSQNENGYVSRY